MSYENGVPIPFQGKLGHNSFIVPAENYEGLKPGGHVEIDGLEDLSECIRFHDGGCVFGIEMQRCTFIYDYTILVEARGPIGLKRAGMLYFTDAAGDRYSLGIASSARYFHRVSFFSDNPTIVKIEWR